MTAIRKPRLPGIVCPHCGAAAIARSSSEVTPLCRELRYRCTDDDCGHGFVAQLAIVHSVTPSTRPNPAIYLPISPAFRPANDRAIPVAANDDARQRFA